ncbi:MAG: HNH endonuclease [Caldilinea sp. CFX5]|nr:HNH endonuclease [Caldilinea sp. CFX5]
MARPRIPTPLDRRIRHAARQRCGYCLSPQHLVMARLEVEHMIPLVKGGTNDETNLWLACPLCNRHKADKVTAADPETGNVVPLFNPRTQACTEHFCWSSDGIRIIGLTPIGRATVVALQLSEDPDALLVRSYWVLAGWHPPIE